MKADRQAVALIELSGGHVECIYSQVLFLRRRGYRIHLLCSEQLRKHVTAFGPLDSIAFFQPGDDFIAHWKCVFAVRRYLKTHRIATVVFNTAGGNHTRDICIVAPRGIRLAGIVHHTHKLKGSFTQFLISLRLKRGFVLNDYLLASIPPSRRIRFESVYLLFREPIQEETINKDPNEFWIGIPGEVDFRRRDYGGLIRELRNRGPLALSVRFVLLGGCSHEHEDGRALRLLISGSGLDRHLVLFETFVKHEIFFGYLRQCDALLPLIHPGTHFFTFYKDHQISGTYNLSFGFAKPMLLHEALRGPEDFNVSAFFYREEELVSLINRLAGHREECRTRVNHIRSCPKFSFDVQYEKYTQFLEQ